MVGLSTAVSFELAELKTSSLALVGVLFSLALCSVRSWRRVEIDEEKSL